MIQNCLKKRSEDWEMESLKLSGISSSAVGMLGPEEVADIFSERTKGFP